MNCIFQVGIDDAQLMAMKRFGRELDEMELRYVQKGVEWGLECWYEVLGFAMDELESEPLYFKGSLIPKK